MNQVVENFVEEDEASLSDRQPSVVSISLTLESGEKSVHVHLAVRRWTPSIFEISSLV